MKCLFAIGVFSLFITQTAFANSQKSCQSNLGEIPHGGSKTGYTTSVSLPGFPCSDSTATLSCFDGSLSGPDLYSSCSDTLQDCGSVSNGSSVSGYESPFGPCISTTVTCTNGSLSGPMPFPSCSED